MIVTEENLLFWNLNFKLFLIKIKISNLYFTNFKKVINLKFDDLTQFKKLKLTKY